MDKIKTVTRLNVSVLAIVSMLNTLTFFTSDKPLIWITYFILPYTALLLLLIFYKSKQRITNGYVFLLLSLFSLFTGNRDSLTPALFMGFSFTMFEDKKRIIIFSHLFIVCIAVKGMIDNYTTPQIINYIVGSIFIIALYIVVTKQENKTDIIGLQCDSGTLDIIQKLANGKPIKEIAYDLEVTAGAINKKLKRTWELSGLKSREQLISYCTEKGYIRLNMDKSKKT